MTLLTLRELRICLAMSKLKTVSRQKGTKAYTAAEIQKYTSFMNSA